MCIRDSAHTHTHTHTSKDIISQFFYNIFSKNVFYNFTSISNTYSKSEEVFETFTIQMIKIQFGQLRNLYTQVNTLGI